MCFGTVLATGTYTSTVEMRPCMNELRRQAAYRSSDELFKDTNGGCVCPLGVPASVDSVRACERAHTYVNDIGCHGVYN